MKRIILFIVSLLTGITASAKEKIVWEYCDGKLLKVFTVDFSSNSHEILRLYVDSTFEHLKYNFKSGGREEVNRIIGKYLIKGSKITFTGPKEKGFSGKFHYGSFFYNGKIYSSYLDMIFRKKNEMLKTTKDRKFYKPFFICLNSEEVISNKEAAEQVDLKRLMDYILKDKKTEQEKMMAIIELIVRSIEYDYDGYLKNTYANNQDDVKNILAGTKRMAVCAGYAYSFNTLCQIAGLHAEKINGNTKQTFADLMHLGGYHAWNNVEIDGKKRLCDITWADDGKKIDMSWIDVDPLVMIGTHFPDNNADQLIAKPISQAAFLNLPVIRPTSASAKPIDLKLSAKQFAGDCFKLVIPGNHQVELYWVPPEMAETYYASEGNGLSRTYTLKQVGSAQVIGDSTYLSFPLTEAINPLEIAIDGQIEVNTVVFKGGQSDLMKHFISKANKKYSDSFVRGIIAAIRLNDVKALKQIVGASNTSFFDKKGKLKLDKSIAMACADWTGDLTSLTKTHHYSYKLNNQGNYDNAVSIEWHIDIPGKVKFTLENSTEGYTLQKIVKL
jgi:hypothetical protein